MGVPVAGTGGRSPTAPPDSSGRSGGKHPRAAPGRAPRGVQALAKPFGRRIRRKIRLSRVQSYFSPWLGHARGTLSYGRSVCDAPET
eukprot:8060841-Pyramimonas_sp.AAC.1